jgi:hypothetical protein
MLVLPDGLVYAVEIEVELAVAARTNLLPFENVSVIADNAVSLGYCAQPV